MSLLDNLKKDMVAAMKAKDKDTLSVVRMLKASVQNEQINLGHDLTPDEENALMAKEYKQRKDSMAEFEKGGRQDLVDATKKEMAVVAKYMPKQMSADEVEKVVEETIAEVNATSMKDFGKVMGAIMPKVKGKADGKVVNETVKKVLQSK
ncbi:YqeY-like protein [Limosilactobacillus coleohominis 101-4-CHN]|uniref:YqeY-like protein n=1 Tax=Limosilactobacillus coleohominis 101-4-CHN TaxID=575594 RepID=C7XU00_9LACO|nr:GatB/YqeY domain-containing protein [Limosilactobacillus coleohominis]EEU30761.1 YqeY-like protein [Limosilactobacillus coleohominis 101-4-CHN]